MARVVDITDKLTFEGKPSLIIKGQEITVNDDAVSVLKLLGKVEEAEKSPAMLAEMAELLFTRDGKENLDSLGLNMNDYGVAVQEAMKLITGGDDGGSGELENPSTTSSETGI